jgi:hypothetical protein
MYVASSEVRNSTAWATCSGSMNGSPNGFSPANAGSTSATVGFSRSGRNSRYVVSFWIMGVSTAFGWTVFTRMPCGPISLTSTFIRPTTACLVAV